MVPLCSGLHVCVCVCVCVSSQLSRETLWDYLGATWGIWVLHRVWVESFFIVALLISSSYRLQCWGPDEWSMLSESWGSPAHLVVELGALVVVQDGCVGGAGEEGVSRLAVDALEGKRAQISHKAVGLLMMCVCVWGGGHWVSALKCVITDNVWRKAGGECASPSVFASLKSRRV